MSGARERKILIGVLSAAGLCLLVDRVVLGSGLSGPAETEAGVLDLSIDPSSLLITPDTIEPAAAEPVSTLADRIRLATQSHSSGEPGGRDAFALPESWIIQDTSDTGPNGADPAELMRAFRDEHKLDAVLVTGDQRCAVVDGQTVYIGQEVGGYRLVSVSERSAQFQADGLVVSLMIQTQRPGD